MIYRLFNFIVYFVLFSSWMALWAKRPVHYHELLDIMKNHSFILKENKKRTEEASHLKNSVNIFAENPMLALGIMNSPLQGFPNVEREAMSGYAFGLSQSFYLPWKKEALEKEAESRLVLSQVEFKAMEQYLAYEVLVRYSRLYFTQEKIKILQLIEKNLKDTQKIFSKGFSAKLSLDFLQKLLLDLEKQKNEIKQTIWDEANLINELKNFLSKEFDTFSALPDLKEVLLKNPLPEFNLKDCPPYQVAEKEEGLAKAAVLLGKSEVFGEFRIEGTYLVRRSAFSHGEDLLTLMISFPLPLTYSFKDKEKILALEKSLEQYGLRLRQRALELEREVQILKDREKILQQNLESLQNKILPSLKNSLKNQNGLLLLGKKDFFEILESFRDLQEWQLREISLLQELCEIRLRIYYLTGKIFSL